MPQVLRNGRASPDIPDDAALGVKGRTNSCLLCFMSFCGQRDIPQGNGATDLFSLLIFLSSAVSSVSRGIETRILHGAEG